MDCISSLKLSSVFLCSLFPFLGQRLQRHPDIPLHFCYSQDLRQLCAVLEKQPSFSAFQRLKTVLEACKRLSTEQHCLLQGHSFWIEQLLILFYRDGQNDSHLQALCWLFALMRSSSLGGLTASFQQSSEQLVRLVSQSNWEAQTVAHAAWLKDPDMIWLGTWLLTTKTVMTDLSYASPRVNRLKEIESTAVLTALEGCTLLSTDPTVYDLFVETKAKVPSAAPMTTVKDEKPQTPPQKAGAK